MRAHAHTHTRTHTLHYCLASLAGEKHWGSLPVSVRNLIMAADSCAMTEVCASGARPLQRGAVSHSALKRHSFPVVISLPTEHHVHSSVGLYALYKPAIHSLKPPSWSGSPFTPRLRRRQDCPHTPWADRQRSVSCQMKIRLEDLNYFPYPFFASSSSCKAVSLIYDMMGPTYWDKHSILALRELPRRTVAILCFRFWGEENLTNGLFPWGMRKRPVWAAREEDDKGKGNTDSVFQSL